MKDQRKTKRQLIEELETLRARLAGLETPFGLSAAAATPVFNRELYEITARSDLELDDKIHQLLAVGCRNLGLDVGMLKRIDGDAITVTHVRGGGTAVVVGHSQPLRDTLCSEAIGSEEPLAIHDIGASVEFARYADTSGFTAYIGTWIFVGEGVYGTLGFASGERRAHPFANSELTNVKLMAQWIGHELRRKQVEDALRASERKHRSLLEAAGDVILKTDLQGKHLYRNQAYYASLGYHADDDVDLDGFALVHPDDRERVKGRLAASVEAGGGTVEYRVRHKDGHWIYRHTRSTVTYDDRGEPEGILTIVRDISDRVEAERALRESEHRYERAEQLARFGHWEWHFAQDTVQRSGEYCRLFGLETEPSRLTPEQFLRVVHPDDRETQRELIRDMVAKRDRRRESELRVVLPNGEERILSSITELRLDTSGEAVAAVGTAYDITVRKHAEQALQESEERFRRLVDHAADAFFLHDLDGRILDVNPEACTSLGYTRDELLALNLGDFETRFAVEDRADPLDDLRGGGAVTFRGVHQRKDGATFPVEVRLAVAGSDRGQVVIALARDVTRRIRAQQALKESEQRFQELYDHAPDMYFTVAADGTVLSVNEFGADCLLYEKHELIGKPVWRIVHPEDRERIRGQVQDILERREGRGELEFRKVRKDGSILWVHERVRLRSTRPGEAPEMRIVCRDITERKRAEVEMKRRNAELESVFQALPDAYFRIAADGTILDYRANPSFELYLPPGRFMDKRIRDVLPEGVGRVLAEGVTEVLATGAHAIVEYSLPLTAGQRLFEARLVRLSSDEVIAVVRDITERKKVELDLRQSQERYRAVSEITTNYAFGFKLKANGELEREWVDGDYEGITGYTADEVEARGGWKSLLHPSDVPLMGEGIRQLLRDGQGAGTLRIVRRDGEVRWLQFFGKAVVSDRPGVSTRIYGAARDVTDQKRANDALRDSEARLKLVTQQLPALLWTTDRDLRITSCSGSVLESMGKRAQEVCGQTWFEFLGSHDEQQIGIVSHRRALENESVIYEEHVGERHFQMHVEPFMDRHGAVTGVIGVGLDVTERRQAELERRRLEAQLRQAQKMDALGVLAGGIAHDFNNVLLAIMGTAELALGHVEKGSRAQRGFDRILLAAERADRLVNQILAFSRQDDQELAPVPIHDIVKDALVLLRATIPTTIVFREKVLMERATVIADPSQIHQILLNLGSNAAHAMRRGGGVFDVELEAAHFDLPVPDSLGEVGPGMYAQLTVRDTGHGMDQETLSRIFEPFFTTKPVGEGTGLGLAVVHGIVKNHQGGIRVVSTPGVGSTFQIFFPVAGEVADVPVEEQEVPRGSDERLLFVDDEAQVVEVGCEQLELLGYSVTAVNDSREAWDLFKAHPETYDVIVTDQTMPRITGLELAEKIRHLRPEIPILLTTGHSELVNAASLARAGVQVVLKKPYRRDVLARAVKRAISDGEKPDAVRS